MLRSVFILVQVHSSRDTKVHPHVPLAPILIKLEVATPNYGSGCYFKIGANITEENTLSTPRQTSANPTLMVNIYVDKSAITSTIFNGNKTKFASPSCCITANMMSTDECDEDRCV